MTQKRLELLKIYAALKRRNKEFIDYPTSFISSLNDDELDHLVTFLNKEYNENRDNIRRDFYRLSRVDSLIDTDDGKVNLVENVADINISIPDIEFEDRDDKRRIAALKKREYRRKRKLQ